MLFRISFLLLSNSWFWLSYELEKALRHCMKQNSEQRQVCRKKHQKSGASQTQQKLTHDISVQKRNTGCEAHENTEQYKPSFHTVPSLQLHRRSAFRFHLVSSP